MFNVFHTKEITKKMKEKTKWNTNKQKTLNLILFQINSKTTLRGKN